MSTSTANNSPDYVERRVEQIGLKLCVYSFNATNQRVVFD